MVAGVELEKNAIGHEMSNQGNAAQHKAGDPWGTRRYLQLCSFTFFARHNLYLGPF